MKRLAVWLLIPLTAFAIYRAARAQEGAEPADREIARGRQVYERHCIGCHGVSGDGQGEVAPMLYPRPRDLTEAQFKFSSRPTPEPPTDEDLLRLLKNGLKGTAMPSFARVPESDLRAVIAYVKSLSPRWHEPWGEPIEIPPDPYASDPEKGVREGDRVYHAVAMCMSCHPSYHSGDELDAMYRALGYEPIILRPEAHLPVPQQNPDGTLIIPPDFARDWIKTGAEKANLYRVISAGITTTAMPTWVDTLPPEQLWGLAYYIHSLAENRPHRIDPDSYRARPGVDRLNPLPSQEPAEEFHSEE